MALSETSRLLRRPGFARYFATVAAARATGTMFSVAGVLLIFERTNDLALAGFVIAAPAGAATAIELQIAAGVVLAALIAGDATFERRPEHAEARPEGVLHAVRGGLVATWRIQPLRWNVAIDCVYVLAWGTLNVGF